MENKKIKKGTRAERVRMQRKNRLKRKLKKLPKYLVKEIVYLTVGTVYASYLLIRGFDNLFVKLFMKLPRWSRAIIIWCLVISNLNYNFDIKSAINKLEVNKLNIKEVVAMAEEEQQEEQEAVCNLDEVSCKIYNKAIELEANEEQALIMIAIAKWETGNYTSRAFNSLNNVGGMMCNKGLIKYDSLDDGINAFVSNLKYNYIDLGLDTIEKIQPKYCPVGASNDPMGLNKNWLFGVNSKFNELNGK